MHREKHVQTASASHSRARRKRQSFNPACHTASSPLTPLEPLVAASVTWSRCTCWWSCPRAILAACTRQALCAAPPVGPGLGTPQAECFLGQLFLGRDFPSARGSAVWGLDAVSFGSPVTAEMVSRVMR